MSRSAAEPGGTASGRPTDAPANVTTYFLDHNVAEGRGSRTALLTAERSWSYGDLAALINRTGNALLEVGVQRGQRVLLALSDSVEFVATWFAAQKIGAVTAEVYTFLQPKDYAYYIEYTDAPVVVVDGVTVERVREALAMTPKQPLLLVAGAQSGPLRDREISVDALVARQSTELAPAVTTERDIAIWKFTTGSTGRPKACVHPVRSPLRSYESYAHHVLDMRADDVVLPVPKLFFGYARDLAALFPFRVGGAGIVFADRSTPELLFELIAKHRPTILVNVPTMMKDMVDYPGAGSQDLSCLRLCTSAGEALPETIHRRWLDTFGVDVVDGIGSSEAYHIYMSNRPGHARSGTIGIPVPGYSARVVDESGKDVANGEIGRLWIQGPTAALMYWNDEEKSHETFGEDLVMSGDLVERDADGFFVFRGRADDLLKVGGIWVAPAEIERCLLTHDHIVECAVIGDEVAGLTRSIAFVVLRPGASLDAQDLRSFLRRRLAPHKVPREFRFSGELPKTGSGKIDRRALRDMLAAATTAGNSRR